MMRHGPRPALESLLSNVPSSTKPALKTTALHALHQELGGRLVPYAGYELPVQYPAGLMAEHRHTRASASLFDVSHMGQLFISGAGASLALESLMPVDVLGLGVGRQRYGMLLTDAGGIIDDLMFLRLASLDEGDRIFMVVNGACKVGDIAHLQSRIGSRCHIEPQPGRALLALHCTALWRACVCAHGRQCAWGKRRAEAHSLSQWRGLVSSPTSADSILRCSSCRPHQSHHGDHSAA